MKKKFLVVCLSFACCCTMLTACGNKKGNENKDPLTGEEMSSTQSNESDETSETGTAGSGEDFESLMNSDDPSGLIDYINTNIGTAGEAESRQYISGLLNFGNDIRDIDFTQLDESKQYMPEDMIAFMELMKLEADTPSMVMAGENEHKQIGLTLSEMLERALLFEQHIEKYPNEVSTDAAKRLYEEIATSAITGGYNKAEGIEHYYHGDEQDTVDKEALDYYKQFAEANEDSNLGKIVKDYVEVLQKANFKINDDMEEFYHNLYNRLQIESEDETSETESESSTSISSTIEGTGTGKSRMSTGTGRTGIGAGGANTGTLGTGRSTGSGMGTTGNSTGTGRDTGSGMGTTGNSTGTGMGTGSGMGSTGGTGTNGMGTGIGSNMGSR